MSQPDWADLVFMFNDGIAEAEDGCTVELDGKCEHGSASWLLILGLI